MRYNTYSDYLKSKYNEKVYKLPINIEATCPNRDGSKGSGGCIFCGEKGAGLENLPAAFSVAEQLEKNIEYIGKRYGAKKYIAYFQNFTNTYVDYDKFMDYAKEAAGVADIVELAFSTRPDCVPDEHLQGLLELSGRSGKRISVELGIQTANYHTLQKVNRGHTIAEFIDAALRIKSFGFGVGAHAILNFPWDDRTDVVETAKIISALKIDTVKLHSLYIEKNTKLCDMYLNQEFEIVSLEEYIERAILFLEHLHPDIAVQRISSRAPSRDTIFCNWGTAWWKIKDRIEELMEERDTKQGSKSGYLEPARVEAVIQPPDGKQMGQTDGRLVLWDIDGTLMHCGSDGTKALNEAFRELFGIEKAMAGAGIGSAMDCAIMDRIMKHFALEPFRKPQIIEIYIQKLHVILENNPTKRVLPGIRQLLDYIENTNDVYSAILTSNFKVGAETKLKSVGLWDYFELGGFGDDEGEKWHAAADAVAAAEKRYGCLFTKENIFIVGDSKYDIECAKKLGYKSIAVATGWMEKDLLDEHEPDYLFEDLGEYHDIIEIISK